MGRKSGTTSKHNSLFKTIKMSKELTENQQDGLIAYRDKWLDKFFGHKLSTNTNLEELIANIGDIYKLCGLEAPIVLLVDSPLACQLAFNALATESDNVSGLIETELNNKKLPAQQLLYGCFYPFIIGQIWMQTGSQIISRLQVNLKEQLHEYYKSNTTKNIIEDFIDEIEAQWAQQLGHSNVDMVYNIQRDDFVDSLRSSGTYTYENFSKYLNVTDFGWLSYYEYFLQETNILNDHAELINKLIAIVDNSFMQIQLKDVCIVSKYPTNITRDTDNNLHNLDGPALTFADGYVQHYVNGTYIPPELFEQLSTKSYTFEQWTKESNEETKSLVLFFYEEKFGGEFLFDFLGKNLQKIDTYVDKKSTKYLAGTVKSMNVGVYTLFKGSLGDIKMAYVQCYCPSTDRMFFLGVNPKHTTAKDAIASLCQVPKKLHPHLVSIARQGEIFSFNFDATGTKLLQDQQLTPEDYQNTVGLKGAEYFAKIKFEY
jgi:hypothetical protein